MDFDNRIAATLRLKKEEKEDEDESFENLHGDDHDVKNNDGTTTTSTARIFGSDCDSNRLRLI
jgi:hypothetical protein